MQGRLYIKTTQIPPFFFAVFQYCNSSFPHTSHYPKQIFHTCGKNSQECGSSFICIIYFFLIYVCIKGHPSSDSGPS